MRERVYYILGSFVPEGIGDVVGLNREIGQDRNAASQEVLRRKVEIDLNIRPAGEAEARCYQGYAVGRSQKTDDWLLLGTDVPDR